jgi:hypothetical protein
MTDEKKPLEVIFAPGCFDTFDGTQEELDEFIAEIHKAIESGEFFDDATPITEESLDDLPDHVLEQLANALDLGTVGSPDQPTPSKRKLH